jgi:PAS domain S-box-containing protein
MSGMNTLHRAKERTDTIDVPPVMLDYSVFHSYSTKELTSAHQLLATLPAMCFTSHPDGQWNYVNPPFCAYTGYPEESLMGMGWTEALHPDDRDTSLMGWQVAIGRGTPLQIEHRIHGADGDHHWVRTHCIPQRNATGTIVGWTGVATPVEMVSAVAVERALRISAEVELDRVIATTAHELRSPLTVLLGQAQILQRRLDAREGADPGDRRIAAMLVEQSLRLAQLIRTLLDAAQIDHGQFLISTTTVDLAALVRRELQALQPTLPTHTLQLRADAAPLWVTGDSMRLAQVLQNLIQNAVIYSPKGSEIVIAVTSQGNHAQISVRDQGCGIAASVHPALFRRFFRVGSEDGRATPGLGLGLYICKAIMDLHKGNIEVESAIGAGSTFTLILPRILPSS